MSQLSSDQKVINVLIKLAVLAALITFCFYLIQPFLGIFMWAVILAIAIAPLYRTVLDKLNGRKKLAAGIVIGGGLLIVLIPSLVFTDSIIESAEKLREMSQHVEMKIPEANEEVMEWPVVGESTFQAWDMLATNTEGFASKYQDEIKKVGGVIIQGMLSIGSAIVQFILSLLIAGVLLATSGTKELSLKFFTRLAGDQGERMIEIVQKTVGSVVKGVLGVALIQGFLIGLGFILAGVPYAGLWAFLVFILAIFQLPPMIIVLPVIIYLFSTMETIYAVLWTIYLLLGGLSDNILKPIILGKGAPVPMLVIFLGVIGGFMTMGFIGMFLGAIILSIGYELFKFWIGAEVEVLEE